ncbi:MAG: hypothetical protein R3B68_02740 [Phycisphaerales bacterium]
MSRSRCVRRSVLERLHVGLADEGVRMCEVPRTLEDVPPSSFFVETVSYSLRGLRFSRRSPGAQLGGSCDGRLGSPVDVVHVFGETAWWLGLEVARLCGSPLAARRGARLGGACGRCGRRRRAACRSVCSARTGRA